MTSQCRLGCKAVMNMIFISYDITVVRGMVYTIMVMNTGKRMGDGPAEQIIPNPENEYSRALIAAAPRPAEHWTKGSLPRCLQRFDHFFLLHSLDQHIGPDLSMQTRHCRVDVQQKNRMRKNLKRTIFP